MGKAVTEKKTRKVRRNITRGKRDKGLRDQEFREARSAITKAKWQDPEYRAKIEAVSSKRKLPENNRRGVPDGMSREQAKLLWAEARAKTEVIFKQMIDSGAIDVVPSDVDLELVKDPDTGLEHYIPVPKTDEGKAALALKECVLAMLSPMNNQAEKQAARRTVLEYTKAKPAQKINATVSHEEFLNQVILDAKASNADAE